MIQRPLRQSLTDKGVTCADGVWFQPCHFNVTSGGFSVVLKGLTGAALGTHYHVGTVRGYTMRGHWPNQPTARLPPTRMDLPFSN